MKLAVTLGRHVRPEHHERAAALAARFCCPLLARKGLEALQREHDVDAFYVVALDHEGLRFATGADTFVQAGLFKTKVAEGRRHPLIRAVDGHFVDDDGGIDRRGSSLVDKTAKPVFSPPSIVERDDVAVASVFDATLGLAGDALHVAAVVGADVTGNEGSLVIHALLEEGLPRLASDPLTAAAARITVPTTPRDSLSALRALPDDSVDVVMLDPMMRRPLKAAPTFDLVRSFAIGTPASAALLLECRRVARRRVVLKLAKGIALPADHPYAFGRTTWGVHVSYRVHRKHVDVVMRDD